MPYKDKQFRKEYLKNWWSNYKIEINKSINDPNRIIDHYSHKPYRRIVEQYLGHVLLPNETIHHINGDNSDNRIDNLFLFTTQSEHMQYHSLLRNWANTFPFIPIEEAIGTYPKLESNLLSIKKEWDIHTIQQ